MDKSHPAGTELRILVVDDDEAMRRSLGRSLERVGYPCTLASNAAEAYALLKGHPFALILCDVNLPGESGLELIRHMLSEHPEVAALMVSGLDRPDYADAALDYGAYGYLVKPFTVTTLRIAVMNALRRRELEMEQRARTEHLELVVLERTSSLRSALVRLEETAAKLETSRAETVRRLSRAMEYRDAGTGEHVDRMSRHCGLISTRFSLDGPSIEVASAMHDIGKIALPDSILLKRGPLTREERELMQTHAQMGRDLLNGSDSEILELAAMIAWTHHERYDGGGYPRGLEGGDIPLEGRVAAVADVFDALTSARPYRPALPVDAALTIMHDERGRHFDPTVLDAFVDLMDEGAGSQERAQVGATGP
jgi:putative two-component system response regulator